MLSRVLAAFLLLLSFPLAHANSCPVLKAGAPYDDFATSHGYASAVSVVFFDTLYRDPVIKNCGWRPEQSLYINYGAVLAGIPGAQGLNAVGHAEGYTIFAWRDFLMAVEDASGLYKEGQFFVRNFSPSTASTSSRSRMALASRSGIPPRFIVPPRVRVAPIRFFALFPSKRL